MQEPASNSSPSSSPAPMFHEPAPARSFPTTAVAIAAVAVIILVAVLVMLDKRHQATPRSNAALPADIYAPNLALSNLRMSESSSMSGGKQTYIEGHIANHGPATVTGITVQVIFANDVTMPAQVESGPLNLIYMRQPYLDTHPVSASSPLAPGAEGDFRLIFDDVNENWNQQLPAIHVVHVTAR